MKPEDARPCVSLGPPDESDGVPSATHTKADTTTGTRVVSRRQSLALWDSRGQRREWEQKGREGEEGKGGRQRGRLKGTSE